MGANAIVYSENEFGKVDGKVANGLVRNSEKYTIVGVIDSTKAGLDAGELLDGVVNGIPVFKDLETSLLALDDKPEYFIYGIAPLAKFIDEGQRQIVISAMTKGLNIVNGLPEFFSENEDFVQVADENNVDIYDIRKPLDREDLHNFSGKILKVDIPVVAVLGTDCAIGKRTTAVQLVKALKEEGLKTIFIATGQTGLLQGAKYGAAIDMLSSGVASGEVEYAVVSAFENESPDIIIVEGQGALSHPAFTSTSSILKGAMPDAVIIQDAPTRSLHCDFPDFQISSLDQEIELIEAFSDTSIIAITINHEGMTNEEVDSAIIDFEERYKLPTTDVLIHGCDKLIDTLLEEFSALKKQIYLK